MRLTSSRGPILMFSTKVHRFRTPSMFYDAPEIASPTIFSSIIPDVAIRQGGHTVRQERQGTMLHGPQKTEESNRVIRSFSPAHRPDVSLAKELEEIMKWLDGLNCAEKQDNMLMLRQPDTCKWLFDTAQYNLWKDGENSFLWLRGKRKTFEVLLTPLLIRYDHSRCRKIRIGVCASFVVLSALTLLLGRPPLIPSKLHVAREKSSPFSIVIFEASGRLVLRRCCAPSSSSCCMNFVAGLSILEA